jgi:hypothetical protein
MFEKYHAGRKAVLVGLAVLLSVFAVSSCETGFDPDTSIPLGGPRSIQVTAGNGSLLLQWTKVAPAQGIIPSYDVYWSSSPTSAGAGKHGNVLSNDSRLLQYSIDNLINEQTYYVWVKAVYAGLGTSDFSPTEYGIPIPPPSVPETLTVTVGEKMLEITWAPVKHAFTYQVYYHASGSGVTPPAGALMVTVSEPGVVISGLNNGTSYTIWVGASNTAGVSPGYQTGLGTPQVDVSAPTTAPGKPDVTAGEGKLTLVWDQVPGVPGYELYYGTEDDIAQATEFLQVPAAAPRVRAEITGLTNDVLYYVWIKSWNQIGTSASSPSASGMPKAKDPINFKNLQFELGAAAAEYIFAQDLAPSVFFPEGRPNTDRLTRVQETALGDLFTDAAAWYIRKNYPDDPIDFVFLNGGYIDNALPKGTITVGSISGIVQPDSRGDKFILLTLTGAELKKFFNDAEGKNTYAEPGDVSGVAHSGRGGPHNTGFFGMVSKEARYTLKYYRAPELGSPPQEIEDREPYMHGFIDTEKDLTINGQPIDDDKEDYRICTTDYLASGEYFVQLAKGKEKRLINTPFWHGVAEYIYDQGTVTPALDGRIKVEGGVPLPPPWESGNLNKPE